MSSHEIDTDMTVSSPEFDRKAEVERLLAEDDTLLGRYWQYVQEGLTRQEMSQRENVSSTGWASNYGFLLESLRDGRIATFPSVGRSVGARIRSWLKDKELSPELRKAFEEQEEILKAIAEDPDRQAEEDAEAVNKTRQAEQPGTPGIYVYTLPHYLRHRYHPDSGRTLLKVGHSSSDAYYRFGSQGRLTALPEDPVLLRIYPCEATRAVEATFHGWLRDADHPGSRTRRGGSEWFVTSTKFLDRIAKSLALEVIEVNDDETAIE